MADIDAKLVKELRDATGAQMMKCKEALAATNGDMEKAKDYLQKKNLLSAGKKADRTTAEGSIVSYIHAGGKIGVMVEAQCETDFVARNEEFQALIRDICMHIAAASPNALTRADVPAAEVAKETELHREQVKNKPKEVVEKIVAGKLDKFYAERVLMEQPFVKDDKMTVGQLVQQKIAKFGENIKITRFIRWNLGGK